MRAKQSGLSIVSRCHRLFVTCRVTEDLINLTPGGGASRTGCHTPSGYSRSLHVKFRMFFYDPVILDSALPTQVRPTRPLRRSSTKLYEVALELGPDTLTVPSGSISRRGGFVASRAIGFTPQSLGVVSGMTVAREQGDQTGRDPPIEAGQHCNRLKDFLAPYRPPRAERDQHRRAGSPDSQVIENAREPSSLRPKASGISRVSIAPRPESRSVTEAERACANRAAACAARIMGGLMGGESRPAPGSSQE
jgi:hypothetical protein